MILTLHNCPRVSYPGHNSIVYTVNIHGTALLSFLFTSTVPVYGCFGFPNNLHRLLKYLTLGVLYFCLDCLGISKSLSSGCDLLRHNFWLSPATFVALSHEFTTENPKYLQKASAVPRNQNSVQSTVNRPRRPTHGSERCNKF